MTSERWKKIQAIFHEAVELPEPEQEALVDRACGGDDALKAEVLAMLAQDRGEPGIVDRGLAGIAAGILGPCSVEPPLPSTDFGPYRIKALLGEGGMGVVYLAEDRENGKLAAIKILGNAALSPARRERFTREKRILAKLNHRHIAQLHHADVLPDGTPWFAMEYVANARHIDVYCRERKCTMEQRLQLFRAVCEAVQYVHAQTFVHRDLKPSNILIAEDGTPKLVDFGIGKEIEDSDGSVSRTAPGLRIMTVAYAAPEQILGSPELFTTDVYALGVVLYQLIAGQHPFDFSDCKTTGDAERKVLDENPPKPSVAARTVPDAPQAAKAQWSDLDAVCLKAMHKEADRRYQTVEALIRDIDHYLDGKPLDAHPDSFGYRSSRFVKRHRRTVAAAAVVMVVIVTLVAFYTIRLARARDAALAEAARTERVERFMLDLLQGGDQDQDVGPPEDTRVAAVIERGTKEAHALDRDPAIQADLYLTLGSIQQSWGKFDQALSLLNASLERRRAVFGADSEKVAEVLLHLGQWNADRDRLPAAEQSIREALAMSQRHAPSGSPTVARIMTALGGILERRGKTDEAASVLNTAVRLQSAKMEQRADLADTLSALANLQFHLGHYGASAELNARTLKLDQDLLGEHHPKIADDLMNLGNIAITLEHYREAEGYFRRALDITRSWYGPDHPDTADNATYVAQALVLEKRYDEAEAILKQALATLENVYGKTPHGRVAMVLNALGQLAQQQGNLDAAAAYFKREADIYDAVHGADHQFTAIAIANLADVYFRKKEYALAERQFRDSLRRLAGAASADPLNFAIAHIKLGRTLLQEKRYRQAEVELLAGYEAAVKQAGPSSSWAQGAREYLVEVYDALAMPDKAARFRAELAANDPNRSKGK
jgi:serine/threonine-protein kinase